MSRGGSDAHRQRLLRGRANRDALTGLDGQERLRAAIDSTIEEAAVPDIGLVIVDNGGKAPSVLDTRGATGEWLIDRVLPTGVVAALADQDDGTPEQVLAQGYDVVLYMHTRGMPDGPFLFEPLWREGLRPGERPPGPHWVRFSGSGFVPCDSPEGRVA